MGALRVIYLGTICYQITNLIDSIQFFCDSCSTRNTRRYSDDSFNRLFRIGVREQSTV